MRVLFDHLKGTLHLAIPNFGTNSRLYETELTESAVSAGKESVLSFMERVLDLNTFIWAAEEMAVTVVECDSDGIKHKL